MTITDSFKWVERDDFRCYYCRELKFGWCLDTNGAGYICQQCTAAISTMQNLKGDHVAVSK